MSIRKQATVDLKLLFDLSKIKNNNNNYFLMLEKYLKSQAWWFAVTSMDMMIMINTSGIKNSGLKQNNYFTIQTIILQSNPILLQSMEAIKTVS